MGGGRLPEPSFVVLGAQKGGTHWVRRNLRAHPEVHVPDDELDFFTRPAVVADRGLEGYRRLFAGWRGEPVVGEATPGYLQWSHGPAAMADAMHGLLPELRPVAVLRDPVDRARSALVHFRRLGVLGEQDVDLVAVARHDLSPEGRDLGLVTGGWYASSLRPYLERFGDQLLVLFHDELVADPGAAYDRLLAHLGLPTGFRPPGLDRPRFAFDGEPFGVPPLGEDQRASLLPLFLDEIAALEGLLDVDLSAWRTPAGDRAGCPVPTTARPAGGPSPSPPPVRAGARVPTLATARLVDLGCGVGDSLVRAQERFGIVGAGVERDRARVDRARARGLHVVQGDLLELEPAELAAAEVVQLDNVLEHLPDEAAVDRVLGLAVAAASRLVVVRHPSFDDVDRLAALGCKLYWTDWHGHTAPVRLADLLGMLHGHGCYQVSVRPYGEIRASAHTSVLPLGAPPDQGRVAPDVPGVYDPDRHGPKPDVAFDPPVPTGFEIHVHRDGGAGVDPTSPLSDDEVEGQVPRSWAARLADVGGAPPVVVERPSGDLVVVEGGMVRKIASPVLAEALQRRLGLARAEPGDLAALVPGPPVVPLKQAGRPTFVVVGGQRLDLPGFGFTLHVVDRSFDHLPAAPPLDVLGAAAALAARRAARRRAQ